MRFHVEDDAETSLGLSLTVGGSPTTTTQPSPTFETRDIFDSPDGNGEGTPFRHDHRFFVVGSTGGSLVGPQSAHRDRFQGVETSSTQWATPVTHPAPHRDRQDDISTYPTLLKSDNGPLRQLIFDPTPVTRLLQPSPVGAECATQQVSPSGNFESLLHAVEVMIEDESFLAFDGTCPKQLPPAISPWNGPPLQSVTRRKKRRVTPVSVDSLVTKRTRQRPERILPFKSPTTPRNRATSCGRPAPKPSLDQGSREQTAQSALQKVSNRSLSKREAVLTSDSAPAAELRSSSLSTQEEAAAVVARLVSTILAHHPTQARKLWVHLVLRNHTLVVPNAEWPRGALPPCFLWSGYPPLERVLQEHAARYYEISHGHNQSRLQAAFYQTLTDGVRAAAIASECDLDHIADPQLRDRIRFYYKTHLQNAKKRLRTLLHKQNTKKHHLAALLPVLRDLEHEIQGNISNSNSDN